MEIKQTKDILGIYPGHDATVVLIRDGVFMEAMSEERLSRCKKHFGFPHLALEYVRNKYKFATNAPVYIAGKSPLSLFMGSLSDNEKERKNPVPRKWFMRALLTRFSVIKIFLQIRDFILLKRVSFGVRERYSNLLEENFRDAKKIFLDHHESHAWATVAFMPRDKKKRLILTLDGEGDDLSGSISIFSDGKLDIKHIFPARKSIGLLYCSVVDILGMKRNEHEFKVMGLAPYAKKTSGERVYSELKEMIWFNEDSMQIESAFDMHEATAHLIIKEIATRHRFDSIAYGIQKLTEEIIKQIAVVAIRKYGISDLALGGGVFMNVKANQYLTAMPEVTSIVITPSCGDESLAIGAAVFGYAENNQFNLSRLETLESVYLGSSYSDDEIKQAIDIYPGSKNWRVEFFDPKKGITVEQKVSSLLANNSVVGRFKGRAEWGARALGNRSILANPTSRDNVKLINEMIKNRDFWMPFATSMLYERRNDYLVNLKDIYAPHMAVTFDTKPLAHKELIAALHPYDLTSRPQMIKSSVNPEYYDLISEFQKLTGIGGILNTSFNLHGEPNVEKPIDALRTFELSGLPHLAIGNYLCSKL